MAVYVDDSKGKFHGMVMSHLFADSTEELHAFAARLGLRRDWFQQGSIPHYDVSQTKRRAALQLGATSLPIRDPNWRKVYRQIKAQTIHRDCKPKKVKVK